MHTGFLALAPLLAGLLAACAAEPRAVGGGAAARPELASPVQRGLPVDLLPAWLPGTEDREVARVGSVVLHESQAFARLAIAQPETALAAVDLLVFDALVMQHAAQFGIQIAEAAIAAASAAEEAQLRAALAAPAADEAALADLLWRSHGLELAQWRQLARQRATLRLYHGHVVRYLALRDDQVTVRLLVTPDESKAREAVKKARAGADFAQLARRDSVDPSAPDGGLLPSFAPGDSHPLAQQALTLAAGEVSEPLLASLAQQPRWCVLYCVSRHAGRDVAYADVLAEIEQDLAMRPLTHHETAAYQLRYRGTATNR